MSEMVRFNLKVTIPKRWVGKFLQMLDCMRWCSRVGASRTVAFYADGDGDFRGFNFWLDGEEVNKLEDWEEYDKEWNPDNVTRYAPQEPPPPYKTWRSINFFFDAG